MYAVAVGEVSVTVGFEVVSVVGPEAEITGDAGALSIVTLDTADTAEQLGPL